MSGPPLEVAIVGGGFSGAAVAYHLARAGVGARVTVYEPRVRLGAGLAYGGDNPVYRINVPATRMSLLPEDPSHFARWLESSGALAADPGAIQGDDAFPLRREFGRYMDETLHPFVVQGRLRHVRDAVVGARAMDGGWRLRTRGDRADRVDLLVIATTHPDPAIPRELHRWRDHPRLIANSLAEDALRDIKRRERILVVGTGLTAADIVASLEARGHIGYVVMISRRGLRSRGHASASFPPEGDFVANPARQATELLANIRQAVRRATREGRTWHSVFDALRAQGQDIWQALEPEARRRVVRLLRPYWDVHRFRAAPQIDAVLDRGLAAGTLEIRRARLGEVLARADGFDVELRDARRCATTRQQFDRIVVATGPAHGDVLRAQSFLRELSDQGAVTLDAAGLGLRTSPRGRAIDAAGRPAANLFVAGPLARGTFGELMGLPQVSSYAKFIADQLREAVAETPRERAPAADAQV